MTVAKPCSNRSHHSGGRHFAAPKEFLRINVAIDLADAVSLITAGRRHEIAPSTVVLGTSAALIAAAYGAATLATLPDAGTKRQHRPPGSDQRHVASVISTSI